jgi:hypothetical protein
MMKQYSIALLLSAIAVFLFMTPTLPAEEPTKITSTRQLFLDDDLIDSMPGVTRRIHPARKHPANPVLRPQEPWEGKVAIIYGSVLREEDKFRMWYHDGNGVGYAESKDGVAWTKPLLDRVMIDGHKTNVVVLREGPADHPAVFPHFYEAFGVHLDPRDPDPQRRYKMGFLSIERKYSGPNEDPFHRGQRRGLGVAASPDGIQWKLLNSFATDAICDGATHWCFDSASNKYLLYGRTKLVPPAVEEAWSKHPWFKNYWGRAVARVESPDFLNWNITAPAKAPVVMTADPQDPPGSEIYSMLVFPYESVYIGLVQLFINRPDDCTLDIRLAVSRDSVHWTRVGDRTPFIPCGEVGTWDRFNNSLAANPPIPVGDELWFYYGGRTYRHPPYDGPDKGVSGGGIGIGAILRDRFVSLEASFVGGAVTTKSLLLAGKTLHLNENATFGTIRVEILDPTGKPIDGYNSPEIQADSLNISVPFGESKSLEPLAGKPVRLRFQLANAQLYSFWVE